MILTPSGAPQGVLVKGFTWTRTKLYSNNISYKGVNFDAQMSALPELFLSPGILEITPYL